MRNTGPVKNILGRSTDSLRVAFADEGSVNEFSRTGRVSGLRGETATSGFHLALSGDRGPLRPCAEVPPQLERHLAGRNVTLAAGGDINLDVLAKKDWQNDYLHSEHADGFRCSSFGQVRRDRY